MPLLRHVQTLFPYSVAISFPCRNNSDKNQANFLESAQNPLTFAAEIVHTFLVFLLHICFRLLVSNVAYGVR